MDKLGKITIAAFAYCFGLSTMMALAPAPRDPLITEIYDSAINCAMLTPEPGHIVWCTDERTTAAATMNCDVWRDDKTNEALRYECGPQLTEPKTHLVPHRQQL